MKKSIYLLPIVFLNLSTSLSAQSPMVVQGELAAFTEHLHQVTPQPPLKPIQLDKSAGLSTQASFKPPVEIIIQAKTDSTNLRLAYAAEQLIFNWERNQMELRVDGGPADGQHKKGMGQIPKNKYVTLRWLVTPTQQQLYVDGFLRFAHSGDYSAIDRPVSIFGAHGSRVTVKSIRVRPLPPGTR
jgi:hypothetical protein